MPVSVRNSSEMRLYSDTGGRQYTNAAERALFIAAAEQFPPEIASFGQTLLYSGCRLSEGLALTRGAIQPEARIITFRTLKRRKRNMFREVVVPASLIDLLDSVFDLACGNPKAPLWQVQGRSVNRSTGYRWIKAIMAAAGIEGAHACPKGLRHGFGVEASLSGVQIGTLSKWMGHASITTTEIYTRVIGREERRLADQMWL